MKTQRLYCKSLAPMIFLVTFPFADLIAAPIVDCQPAPESPNKTICSVKPDTDSLDDAYYINQAIIKAGELGGGVVYLEAGEFEIKKAIDLAPNVTLRGRNPENIPAQRFYPNLQLDKTVVKYTGLSSTFNMMVWICPSNVEISNLTLDGNPYKYRYSNVLYGIYTQRVPDQCEAKNLKVRNVRIIRTARAGIECVGGEDPIIQKNTITGLTGKSNNSERLGIELQQGCNGSVVEDNALDEWLSVVEIYNCAVRRNQILGRSDNMDYPYGLEFGDGAYCVFSGNTVSPGAQIGLSIARTKSDYSTAYAFWYNNKINQAVTFGVQLNGDITEYGEQKGSIRTQYFYQNTFSSTGVTTLTPWYRDIAGQGFRFTEYCADITLEENTINNNKRDGIELSDNLYHLSFIRNTVNNNSGYGVNYGQPIYALLPSDIEWNQNSVFGNGDNSQLPSQGFNHNATPTAKFGYNSMGSRKYMFTNQSSDPDGDLLTVMWDLGEGSLVIGSNEFEHTFSQGGGKVYNVSLIVWDEPEENGKGRGQRFTQAITVD